MDNPVWSALTSGNNTLSIGNDKAKRFQLGISSFVAAAQHDLEHYTALKKLVPSKESVAIFTTDKNLDAGPWNIVSRIAGYQMMYEGEAPDKPPRIAIAGLTESNVPAMLALTQLSPPGPFM